MTIEPKLVIFLKLQFSQSTTIGSGGGKGEKNTKKNTKNKQTNKHQRYTRTLTIFDVMIMMIFQWSDYYGIK